MPEGDTVWRTAHRLHQALAGAEVVLCDLRFPSLATLDLRGASTLEVVSRGKHLLHRFDNGITLHSHLKMEGQWRVEAPPDTPRWLRRDDLRAAVGSTSWSALGLRLGLLEAVPTSAEATLVGHLGPDLLGPDWDLTAAVANLRSSHRPDRGRPARPAQPGRHRHSVGRRVALPVAPRAVDPGRRARRGRPRTAGHPGADPARPGPPPRRPVEHWQPPEGRGELRARPVGSARVDGAAPRSGWR